MLKPPEHRLCVRLIRCLVCTSALIGSAPGAIALDKSDRIAIAYGQPKDSAHEGYDTLLKKNRVLETLQTRLSPLRLPRTLTLSFAGCDGESNAFYENDKVQVCYEMVDQIVKNAPKQTTPSGVERSDVIVGSLLFLFLHEVSHALFDMLDVPLFGSEEDAADHLAAYNMLQLDKDQARRLITGAAYAMNGALEPETKITLKEFADEHGLPAQRFFNLLCVTYGAETKFFGGIVDKGYLPKERAENCDLEYEQAAYAFKRLITPHIDRRLQLKLRTERWVRDVLKRPSTRKAKSGSN